MPDDRVRVRYAPSPTGDPHVGNIRTALFAWLFARHTGGDFIVRIEDTDTARTQEGSLEAILESLRWLGLEWDEGPEVGGPHSPYVQSQRRELYQNAARSLVEAGHAYYCHCTPERLHEMRKEQQRLKQPTGYDRLCREAGRGPDGDPSPVVRFKMPLEGETTFNDLIRGEVTFANATVDDFVMLKSDGYPTYHLASTVDDHLMDISHVLRAEEWLPSTPRHVHLYDALGYDMPLVAHLPIILGPDKSKLSKRHGDVALLQYREMGYLPEAMINFLALLGWSLDNHTELLSRDDLVNNFSIERIVRSAAVFNLEKLTWMNGVYIRNLGEEELAERIAGILDESLSQEVARPVSRDYVRSITPLVRERIRTMTDIPELTDFFFLRDLDYPPADLVQRGLEPADTANALDSTVERLAGVGEWTAEALEGELRPLAEELNVKTGQLFGAIRVAVTGRKAAPPLFETMAVLGRDLCLERLRKAVASVSTVD
ncbi:MAG: glutamate--tRNA ligase [Chloroflexota bacterium]|nr:glutamate--tRNA ligase [Chloroflexota bacterium]